MLERIRREGGVSIAELAETHDVSTITVHRDLAELSSEGLIERVHGGARALNGQVGGARIETAWDGRVAQARDAKAAMGAARPGGAQGTCRFGGASASWSAGWWRSRSCSRS